MKFKNRPYQDNAESDIDTFMFESSHKKGILVSPVGTGKSLYPAMIAGKSKNNTLVLQPNKELLIQNVEKARAFGLDPSIYSASAKSKEISDLTYATPMSVVSDPEAFKRFDTVVIDEAHLNMSNKMSSGKVSEKGKLNLFLDHINPSKIIGLTATPIQLVTTGMGSELKMMNRSRRSFWINSPIFHVTQIPDIHEKYWADISVDIFDNDDSLLQKARYNSPEFTKESIAIQYDRNNIDHQIMEQYERMISDGKDNILTFVPSVEQAIKLANGNKDFEVVHGGTKDSERDAIVSAFKRGDIANLINCEIFTAGFDSPRLNGIIMGRETMSFQLYYQIYGRIVRPLIDNGNIIEKKGLIVDLTSNTKRFGDVKNVTFEDSDCINGWGMWCDNKLMSGTPFGDWNMPSRDSLEKAYIKKGSVSRKKSDDDTSIVIKFGKYKGLSLNQINKKDPRYLHWMKESFDFKGDHLLKVKEEIELIINNNLMHGS